MRVGVTLPTFRDDAAALDAARRAEALGLDGVFVFDHLWPLGQRGSARPVRLPRARGGGLGDHPDLLRAPRGSDRSRTRRRPRGRDGLTRPHGAGSSHRRARHRRPEERGRERGLRHPARSARRAPARPGRLRPADPGAGCPRLGGRRVGVHHRTGRRPRPRRRRQSLAGPTIGRCRPHRSMRGHVGWPGRRRPYPRSPWNCRNWPRPERRGRSARGRSRSRRWPRWRRWCATSEPADRRQSPHDFLHIHTTFSIRRGVFRHMGGTAGPGG